MKFGSRIAPVSHHPDDDSEVIDRTLREVDLAEAAGMYAVWLTEHHFSGECAYTDPLVFGAAIAARTSRIKIGFAVLQMALHEPVLLATQTALLDNLSHGRLIVGTGRGTAVNHFEYAGFGTTMEEGAKKLAEAEALLVKAWTCEDLQFKGKYWEASFPMLRPRPFQKPHPPLARACLSEESVANMARIRRPILIGGASNGVLGQRLDAYRKTMATAGFDQAGVDEACSMSWVSKSLYIADSYEEARDAARISYLRDMGHIQSARKRYDAPVTGPLAPRAGESDEDVFDNEFILGTPSQVADQIAELRDLGVRNLMLQNSFGGMSFDKVRQTLTQFGEEVIPLFS